MFWSSIRSFVRSFNVPLIALMLFLLACMQFLWKVLRENFIFILNWNFFSVSLPLIRPRTHCLFCERAVPLTPPFETLLFVCVFVCSSASLIKCWNYLDSHNSFDITLFLCLSVCLSLALHVDVCAHYCILNSMLIIHINEMKWRAVVRRSFQWYCICVSQCFNCCCCCYSCYCNWHRISRCRAQNSAKILVPNSHYISVSFSLLIQFAMRCITGKKNMQ